MGYTKRLDWEELRVFDSASLTGGYDPIGGPLENPAVKLKMVNLSDVTVTVSRDGLKDIDVCPTQSFWLYDENLTTEHESVQAGTQFYIRGTAGTGNIYLVAQYRIQT